MKVYRNPSCDCYWVVKLHDPWGSPHFPSFFAGLEIRAYQNHRFPLNQFFLGGGGAPSGGMVDSWENRVRRIEELEQQPRELLREVQSIDQDLCFFWGGTSFIIYPDTECSMLYLHNYSLPMFTIKNYRNVGEPKLLGKFHHDQTTDLGVHPTGGEK